VPKDRPAEPTSANDGVDPAHRAERDGTVELGQAIRPRLEDEAAVELAEDEVLRWIESDQVTKVIGDVLGCLAYRDPVGLVTAVVEGRNGRLISGRPPSAKDETGNLWCAGDHDRVGAFGGCHRSGDRSGRWYSSSIAVVLKPSDS